MGFWAALVSEAADDATPWVVLGWFVTAFLVRWLARDERPRLRPLLVLTGLHVLMIPILAGLRAGRAAYYPDVRMAALTVETLAGVGLAGVIIFGVILPRLGLRAPSILRDVIAVAATAVVLALIANRAGFPISGLVTTSAVLTAVVGFSGADTLGNVLGGLALQLDNSIRVGDWVKVGEVRGQVSEMRWRYTAIETRNWETVIIPNSVLMKGQVVVEGRRAGQPTRLRRWVWFNVDFRHQPSDVIEAVNEALQGAPIERVAEAPAAHCILMDLTDSFCRYAVRYWLTELQVDDPTDSQVRTRIYFALKRAQIPLSIPAHAVFMTEENLDRKAEKIREDQDRRMSALAHVDLLADLDEATRARLAGRLRYAPFTRGEAMTRQGAEAHWLYIMVDGRASVRIAADGVEKEVAQLGPGNFFGEMSLMTGARRSATVVALTDVECYRLDKAAFQDVIHERPELAGRLAELLAQRHIGLTAARENLDAAAREHRLAAAKHDILDKIREFFGLVAS